MNFKLELVFAKHDVGLWTFLHVPAHMITVGDGDGKKFRSVPEVFLAASPLMASAYGGRFVYVYLQIFSVMFAVTFQKSGS